LVCGSRAESRKPPQLLRDCSQDRVFPVLMGTRFAARQSAYSPAAEKRENRSVARKRGERVVGGAILCKVRSFIAISAST